MKNKLKAAAAAVTAFALLGGALPVIFAGVELLRPAVTAHAYETLTFDEDAGVLTLHGNVDKEEVRDFLSDLTEHLVWFQVGQTWGGITVKCEEGTVFPEDCSYMFATIVPDIDMRDVLGDTGYYSDDSDEEFWYCPLAEVDLRNADTSHVTNVSYMFDACEFRLTSIDLSSFDMHNVADARGMFNRCTHLNTIYVGSDWNLNQEKTDCTDMFRWCFFLTGGSGTAYSDDHDCGDYAHIDGGAENPGYLTFAGSTVKGASLSLDGTITVNFYIRPSSKAAKVSVKSLNDPNETFVFDLKEEDSYYKQADGSFKIPAHANAAQAGVKFTLKVLDAAGNPLDIYNSDYEKLDNQTVSYSVNDYIADTAQYSDDALVKNLVEKLDTYCKAAENYFCGTSHALDIPAVNITKTNNYNKQFKISLVLDSTTELRIYSDASQCQVPFGTEYATLLCEQNSKGRYFRRFVPAHKLLNDDTIILDGVTYKVNPMDYCAMVFAKDGGDPNLTAVCAALYHYGAAAKEYYENQQQ